MAAMEVEEDKIDVVVDKSNESMEKRKTTMKCC